ncbi:hypothetical protein [Colwellia sp. Bg11-28]|uniref:hypothetical protein n=1 Tax=Colwellia sp. Bg11-28 TaxID=2058305 RepID=UPI0012FED41F|nr:hypothetical protein [Colwellia sp. Bg11-28]
MTSEEFKRLNFLSEKSVNEDPTHSELVELKRLLTMWNVSTEYNLLLHSYTDDSKD